MKLFADRLYQRECVAGVQAGILRGKPTLLASPTRSGKTEMMLDAFVPFIQQGWKVALGSHRHEIRQQHARACEKRGIAFGVIESGTEPTSDAVHLFSVDTLRSRLDNGCETLAAWCAEQQISWGDEAHHLVADGWERTFARFTQAVQTGATATPYRLDGRGLGDVFQVAVRGPQPRQLIADGYLVQPITYAPRSVNLSGVRSIGGEFHKGQAGAVVSEPAFLRFVADCYARFAPGQPAIFFWPTVKAAQAARNVFHHAGWRTAHVDGTQDPDTRSQNIYGLEDGRVQVLHAVDVVSEGTDLPRVAVAGLCDPTKSTNKFMQRAGRVLTPDAGKLVCFVLDFVGNFARHGLVDQDRDWDLFGLHSLERQVGSLRRCGRCHRVMELAEGTTRCPSCGRKFPALRDTSRAVQLALLPDVRGVPAEEVVTLPFQHMLDLIRSRDDAIKIARAKTTAGVTGYDRQWVARVAREKGVA